MNSNDLQSKSYFDIGLPNGKLRMWNGSVYALYSYIHKRFIYIHHNFELVKHVQFFISSKYPVWVFQIKIPSGDIEVEDFDNITCTNFAPPDTVKLTAQDYQVTFANLYEMDCSNVNVLREMTGIKRVMLEDTPETIDTLNRDRDWLFFVAACVKNALTAETTSAALLYRILLLDRDKHNLEQSNTLYEQVSKLYKILMVETDITTAQEKISNLAISPAPMGMHFSHILHLNALSSMK
jgi:hypothetical protein